VLDEVDAPLDEANIVRFLGMLQKFKERTQFVIITHHPRTMEAADWLYGVTMEEPGISSIVGVKLDDVLTPASNNGAPA
jgi:chromosome segregation protein